jgi:PAS domain S-box-containing protein
MTRYGVPFLGFGIALLLRACFAPWLENDAPFAFLLPAVFIAAWVGGLSIGFGTVVAGGILALAHFTQPFTISTRGEAVRLALFAANGALVTLLSTALQHTVRRARDRGDEAARNFAIMANNAPVLIWCSDAEGRCHFVNRNWIAFTGRSSASGKDTTRPGQIHPDDDARYRDVLENAIQARAPFEIEYRLLRADGAYRWLLEHAVPRYDQDGRYEGYIGSCSDVTDSHNKRDELAFLAGLQGALAESLDLEKCADVLVQAVVPRLADWCRIEFVDEQGVFEHVRSHHFAWPPAPHGAAESPARKPDARAEAVAKTGERQLLRRQDEALLRALASDEAHYQRLRAAGGLTYLAVPLRARGRIVGVLSLANAESGRALGAEECNLVDKIAGLAGFALDNAQLYRSARQALAAEEHALRELKRSERRFRFAWEANIFGMCTITPAGRVISANRALTDLLSFTAEEIAAGRASLRERTAERSRAAEDRAQLELQLTGRCAPFEKEFLRPDGQTVHALVCGGVFPDNEECMVFVLDLTARKVAERALDRQRTLLKTIIDAMPAMVAYIGPDERFWLHNEKYQKWLGVSSEAIHGRTMRELIGEEAHDRVAPYLSAAFRGRNMRHETTLRSANRERHLIASYRPDRDADGRVCGLVVHAYDITERKETEQALADALTRYRFLADAMPQMVWTALPNGQLDYVNRRWLETTGMTEDASLGCEGWLDAVHPEDRHVTREQWRNAVASCTPFEHDCRLRCGKEAAWRWHLVRALPRRDDHGNVAQWVGSATDIDEQRRAYAELADARTRLKSHADELEARVRVRTATLREANAELEAFTYSVSHDLRTPLQFVRGFAEAIRSDAADNLSPENRDYLHRIIRAASRMDTIIQDLLGYSRLARAEMQLIELPLDEMINDVLAHHHAVIRESGAHVQVARPLPVVLADKTGLFQALSNLVSNALKFTRPGDPPEIRIRCETTEAGTRLWVEDGGIGIDPRHHERIFKLFERLHSPAEYPGTGIGLSLVRKAVMRMGGQCGVESQPNQGSRFWIEFPQACAVAPAVSHAL